MIGYIILVLPSYSIIMTTLTSTRYIVTLIIAILILSAVMFTVSRNNVSACDILVDPLCNNIISDEVGGL